MQPKCEKSLPLHKSTTRDLSPIIIERWVTSPTPTLRIRNAKFAGFLYLQNTTLRRDAIGYNEYSRSEGLKNMAKALYRKYRSTSLDEVIGQKHVTDILSRSLKSGVIAHAYLLTGPRGVGKTSIARILAFEINKITYDENTTNLDIIEIDAASNNGVENIRDLIEKVQIAPVAAAKKIYIIDEVHMLSKSAFNAFSFKVNKSQVFLICVTSESNSICL